MNHSQTVFIPEQERIFANEFLQTYSSYVYQGTVEHNVRIIKKIKQRFCRFCGKNSTQVTFKKDAHLIPKLLGSRRILSSEECDNCNELFGKFESHLASYLGIYRTINSDSKAPGFESANGNIRIKNHSGIIFISRNNLDKDFHYDNSNNEMKISIQSQSYLPHLVYNSLLKTALSIMPKEDLNGYKPALKFLQDKNNYGKFPEIKQVQIVESDVTYEFPFAELFKRKTDDTSFPLHIFCLYVQNFMFQICFPLHAENIEKRKNELTVKIAPYVILGDVVTNRDISIKRYQDNLGLTEITNSDNSLIMRFNPNDLKNLVKYDPSTNSITNLN